MPMRNDAGLPPFPVGISPSKENPIMRILPSLLAVGAALAASACTVVERQPAPATVVTPVPQASQPSTVIVRP